MRTVSTHETSATLAEMPSRPTKIVTYEDFLAASIERYWRASGASKRTFLSLLLATEEAWRVAWHETKRAGLAKPLLAGAAGVATAAYLLRVLATGPFGLLLTGVSAASLVALYATEHDAIRTGAADVRRVVDTYRGEFDSLRDERKTRHVRDAQWELMMDGLMSRFLVELDGALAHRFDPATAAGFAEHVHAPSLRPPSRGR